jgi:hypothetical protein
MATLDEPDGGESSCYVHLVCPVCQGLLSENTHDECQPSENEMSEGSAKE